MPLVRSVSKQNRPSCGVQPRLTRQDLSAFALAALLSCTACSNIIGIDDATVEDSTAGNDPLAPCPSIISDALLVYWTFNAHDNKEIKDCVGDHPGTMGGEGPSDIVVGKLGNALELSNGAYMSTEYAPAFKPFVDNAEAGDPFTISMWAKTTSTEASYLFGFSTDQKQAFHLALGVPAGTSKTEFCLKGDNNSGLCVYGDEVQVQDGQWHHFAATHRPRNQILKLYIDGAEVAKADNKSPDTVVNSAPDSLHMYVGYANDESNAYESFEGSIDDFRLYNKSLSGTDIVELIDSTSDED